jgi:CrcB protein
MEKLLDCIFVGFGGMFGSVARYLISLFPLRQQSGFPLPTLGVNLAGAFLIGLIVAFAGKNTSLDPRALLFLKVGVCGGFTTFSTFALETQTLLHGGRLFTGLSYAALSVVLCIGAITAANALVK